MYNSHREAFQQKSNSKKPIESNLDSIINQAQTKMKEMILEKQNYQKKRNLLIGKERVLDENINSLKSEINDKNDDIKEKEKIFFEIEQNIKNLENEKKLEIKKANEKEAKLKDDINNINEELNRIKDGTIPAQASKTFDLKKNCEEVNELKKKNNQLRETLYLLSRRLYTLEVSHIIIILIQAENERSKKDEEISANKAKIGIENIEEFYRRAQEINGDEEENEEEDEENRVRSDNEIQENNVEKGTDKENNNENNEE